MIARPLFWHLAVAIAFKTSFPTKSKPLFPLSGAQQDERSKKGTPETKEKPSVLPQLLTKRFGFNAQGSFS